MSHSLRAKLRVLRYKGILEDKDYMRLCHTLDLEKAEKEPKDKSNLEKICEELAAENDNLRDQLAMRDRFKQEPCDDAQERYEDLCEYFGDAKDILKSRKDFKAWLERIKWHVHKAEELYEKYEHKQEPCEDAISREDAIHAFDYLMGLNRAQIQDILFKLPSVMPKPVECDDAISRQAALKELKESAEHHANDSREEALLRRDRDIIRALPPVTPQPCEDAVSRQAVLDCATLITSIPTEDWDIGDWVCLFRDRVSQLPSVRSQEPKTGHWISHREHCRNLGVMPSGLGAYEWCSNCDCGIDVREWHRNNYNFCPNCGARMESKQNE